ncbi:DeoR/GlpR family DNA-binding transcription regulator [Xanthobacteraceae bacterium Astr-EGSB]|uniref:DeoR/GlpR family DNA-binding transcription regulator n=1 Tax=Astrobacterium formosum TaxID=3069710 RepID=UPI0027AEB335|nr:DeoR/GlpR family DNA-binding transcription regulator [Xanthobacteraceae bacterium Astr-EGSB]
MSRTRLRREHILALIRGGEEDVEVLARQLDVSPSTIRRDLAVMRDEGAVMRTYGGAVLAQIQPEEALATRETENRAAKEAIARAAAALIADGDSVLLDAGSTVGALGHLLSSRRLTVVTGNLPLLPVLAHGPAIELIVLGGAVRSTSMGVVGPLAEQTLRRITVDKAFLGCDGLVAGRGLCEASAQQTALKELMAEQAAEVFVLADATKLGRASQPYWAPLPRHWSLVTDAVATDDQIAPFARSGVRVIRAPRGDAN